MAPDSMRNRALETAIDAVVESYDGPEEINNLESHTLPNARKVIEAFKHVQHAIYMGFYSTCEVTRESLRSAVSVHMHEAHDLLIDQIERAIGYKDRQASPSSHPGGWGEQVVLELFDALPELRRRLNGDVQAAYRGDPAAMSVEEIVFSYPSIEAVTAHRVAHLLHEAGVPLVPRIIAEHAHATTGIDIHPGATIGADFFIDHGTGVVIGETTRIGERVKIYQGVTLGALSTRRSDLDKSQRHPTIEDDVTIYAGATILGGGTVIGAGSVIGGNVWLTHSVPPGTKVFGRKKS